MTLELFTRCDCDCDLFLTTNGLYGICCCGNCTMSWIPYTPAVAIVPYVNSPLAYFTTSKTSCVLYRQQKRLCRFPLLRLYLSSPGIEHVVLCCLPELVSIDTNTEHGCNWQHTLCNLFCRYKNIMVHLDCLNSKLKTKAKFSAKWSFEWNFFRIRSLSKRPSGRSRISLTEGANPIEKGVTYYLAIFYEKCVKF